MEIFNNPFFLVCFLRSEFKNGLWKVSIIRFPPNKRVKESVRLFSRFLLLPGNIRVTTLALKRISGYCALANSIKEKIMEVNQGTAAAHDGQGRGRLDQRR